ncbi:MAG: restriction endonuclease subunit S [Proteobacteria bacterium]|nr:restriction endonuclease subunit S [Pseudomonadota bacterium]
MKGWARIKAKDLVTFKTGKLDSNAAEADGKYPFFTCAQETYRINKCAFDTECVLLAGNNADGIFPLKYYKGKFNAYQRTYIIEPKDRNEINTRYIYESFKLFLKSFEQTSTGATTKFLTMGILNNLWISKPPLPIQRKIAAILSAYDDLIENNNRRIAILEKMAEEIYREWFVRMRFPGHEKVKFHKGVPEEWETLRLGMVLELAYGKALKEHERIQGPFPVYGSSGVVGYHNKHIVNGPGIIVGRKGNVGSVSWSDSDFYPIDTVYYVKSAISLYYLFFLLQGLNFLNSDAAVPGLNRNQAYSSIVYVPEPSLLVIFDDTMKCIFTMKRNLFIRN